MTAVAIAGLSKRFGATTVLGPAYSVTKACPSAPGSSTADETTVS